MKHTPEPWHYISGAVYANPRDADAPEGVAIAVRGVQRNPCIPDQFSPTTKDANMRLIAQAPAMLAALDLAAATIELHTGNGAQSQPDWPRRPGTAASYYLGDIDYAAIAKQLREIIRDATS